MRADREIFFPAWVAKDLGFSNSFKNLGIDSEAVACWKVMVSFFFFVIECGDALYLWGILVEGAFGKKEFYKGV